MANFSSSKVIAKEKKISFSSQANIHFSAVHPLFAIFGAMESIIDWTLFASWMQLKVFEIHCCYLNMFSNKIIVKFEIKIDEKLLQEKEQTKYE